MQTIGITKFKANAPKFIDQVNQTQEVIVITRRGKPVAQVLPCNDETISTDRSASQSDTSVSQFDFHWPLDEIMWGHNG